MAALLSGCAGDCPDQPGFTVEVTVDVKGAGTGNGNVSDDRTVLPAGTFVIDCAVRAGGVTGACNDDFLDHGGQGTFSVVATADAGSILSGWPECPSVQGSQGERCSMTIAQQGIQQTFTVRVKFDPVGTVTVSVGGTGSGSGRVIAAGLPQGTSIDCTITAGSAATTGCSASFSDGGQGGSFSLDATANQGSAFASWTGCSSGAQNPCTLSYPGGTDATFTATARFDLANTVAVTVQGTGSGNGRVVGAGLPAGTSIDCTITAGSASPTGCSASFTVAVQGGAFTLDATANAGSAFTNWTGCPGSNGLRCTLTFPGGTNTTFAVTAGFDLIAPPPPPPVVELIAFASERDGNSEIYTTTPDGLTVKRLTTSAGADGGPSWSRDGNRIAFDSDRLGNLDIFVMNADGTVQPPLTTHPADDFEPSWSPDAKRIVFVSDRTGNEEIWSMKDDGTDLKQLTNSPGIDEEPVWSPDGSQILFVSDRNGGDLDIFVMNADGTGPVTPLTSNSVNEFEPNWSPDGTRIVFESLRDGNNEIYTMSATGQNQLRRTINAAEDANPVWSPDGRKIAFMSNRDGNREIYIMNEDGTGLFRLTTNAAKDDYPSWIRKP